MRRQILAGPSPRAKKTQARRARASTPTFTCTTSAQASSWALLMWNGRSRTIRMPIMAMPPNPIPKINPRSPSSSALKKVQCRKVAYHVRCKWCAHPSYPPLQRRDAPWMPRPRVIASWWAACEMKYPCWRRAAIKSIRQLPSLRAKWPVVGLKKSMKDLTRVSSSLFKSFLYLSCINNQQLQFWPPRYTNSLILKSYLSLCSPTSLNVPLQSKILFSRERFALLPSAKMGWC